MAERRAAVKQAAAEVEDLRRLERGEEPLTKRMRTREMAYRLMVDFAKDRAHEGEDPEFALARLMAEADPEISTLLAAYNEA